MRLDVVEGWAGTRYLWRQTSNQQTTIIHKQHEEQSSQDWFTAIISTSIRYQRCLCSRKQSSFHGTVFKAVWNPFEEYRCGLRRVVQRPTSLTTLKAARSNNHVIKERGHCWCSLFFYAHTKHYVVTMRTINELINSGKTLNKREREAVERHLEAHSKRISIQESNDMKCRAAIQKRSKYGAYG